MTPFCTDCSQYSWDLELVVSRCKVQQARRPTYTSILIISGRVHAKVNTVHVIGFKVVEEEESSGGKGFLSLTGTKKDLRRWACVVGFRQGIASSSSGLSSAVQHYLQPLAYLVVVARLWLSRVVIGNALQRARMQGYALLTAWLSRSTVTGDYQCFERSQH